VAIFTTIRKSRVLRKCDTCRGKIRPGDRYEHAAITPDHDDFGNTRWLTYHTHLSPDTCYQETRYQ
jgi:hypothetical protein